MKNFIGALGVKVFWCDRGTLPLEAPRPSAATAGDRFAGEHVSRAASAQSSEGGGLILGEW
jgi:hypothetical protein